MAPLGFEVVPEVYRSCARSVDVARGSKNRHLACLTDRDDGQFRVPQCDHVIEIEVGAYRVERRRQCRIHQHRAGA